MVTTTKFTGISYGKKGGDVDVSGVVAVARGSFDPTSVTQIEIFVLPAGAVPVWSIGYGGATGGTNPTIDLGTAANSLGFVNELDADGASIRAGATLLNVQLLVDTPVYGVVGASAATGGTAAVAIAYIMEDL